MKYAPVSGLLLSGCLAALSRGGADRQAKQASSDCLREQPRERSAARALPEKLDGRWQCFYSDNLGGSVSESLSFNVVGRDLTVTGRDNDGDNVLMDGRVSENRLVFQVQGRSLTVLSSRSDQLLDGNTSYVYEDDSTGATMCHRSRYTCQRR
ncbi:MAG TPA: hypothetical protein VIU61_21590 [Kofleriaceae bacterium]